TGSQPPPVKQAATSQDTAPLPTNQSFFQLIDGSQRNIEQGAAAKEHPAKPREPGTTVIVRESSLREQLCVYSVEAAVQLEGGPPGLTRSRVNPSLAEHDGPIVARDRKEFLSGGIGKCLARIPSSYPIRCLSPLQSDAARSPYNSVPNSERMCNGMLASVCSAQDDIESGLADAPL
ncbi:hypothetical protein MRX96_051991, partial [Rhipicephalus microplus]